MRSAIANKPFYQCPKTGRTSVTKKQGWIRWDSRLEMKVFQLYSIKEIPLVRQFPVEILPKRDGWKPFLWKCDFFNPLNNEIIEAKGKWILEPRFKAEKAKFILQCGCALFAGYKLTVLSDSEFDIGPIKALDYQKHVAALKATD